MRLRGSDRQTDRTDRDRESLSERQRGVTNRHGQRETERETEGVTNRHGQRETE